MTRLPWWRRRLVVVGAVAVIWTVALLLGLMSRLRTEHAEAVFNSVASTRVAVTPQAQPVTATAVSDDAAVVQGTRPPYRDAPADLGSGDQTTSTTTLEGRRHRTTTAGADGAGVASQRGAAATPDASSTTTSAQSSDASSSPTPASSAPDQTTSTTAASPASESSPSSTTTTTEVAQPPTG